MGKNTIYCFLLRQTWRVIYIESVTRVNYSKGATDETWDTHEQNPSPKNPLNGGNVARIIQDRANTNRRDGTADRYTATITGRAKVCGVKARGCVFYRLVYKYRKLYILLTEKRHKQDG